MTDAFGKRSFLIGGIEQTFDNIDDLAGDIDLHMSSLRKLAEALGNRFSDQALEEVSSQAQAQVDRMDAYDTWSKEISSAEAQLIDDLLKALRDLPRSAFDDGGPQ